MRIPVAAVNLSCLAIILLSSLSVSARRTSLEKGNDLRPRDHASSLANADKDEKNHSQDSDDDVEQIYPPYDWNIGYGPALGEETSAYAEEQVSSTSSSIVSSSDTSPGSTSSSSTAGATDSVSDSSSINSSTSTESDENLSSSMMESTPETDSLTSSSSSASGISASDVMSTKPTSDAYPQDTTLNTSGTTSSTLEPSQTSVDEDQDSTTQTSTAGQSQASTSDTYPPSSQSSAQSENMTSSDGNSLTEFPSSISSSGGNSSYTPAVPTSQSNDGSSTTASLRPSSDLSSGTLDASTKSSGSAWPTETSSWLSANLTATLTEQGSGSATHISASSSQETDVLTWTGSYSSNVSTSEFIADESQATSLVIGSSSSSWSVDVNSTTADIPSSTGNTTAVSGSTESTELASSNPTASSSSTPPFPTSNSTVSGWHTGSGTSAETSVTGQSGTSSYMTTERPTNATIAASSQQVSSSANEIPVSSTQIGGTASSDLVSPPFSSNGTIVVDRPTTTATTAGPTFTVQPIPPHNATQDSTEWPVSTLTVIGSGGSFSEVVVTRSPPPFPAHNTTSDAGSSSTTSSSYSGDDITLTLTSTTVVIDTVFPSSDTSTLQVPPFPTLNQTTSDASRPTSLGGTNATSTTVAASAEPSVPNFPLPWPVPIPSNATYVSSATVSNMTGPSQTTYLDGTSVTSSFVSSISIHTSTESLPSLPPLDGTSLVFPLPNGTISLPTSVTQQTTTTRSYLNTTSTGTEPTILSSVSIPLPATTTGPFLNTTSSSGTGLGQSSSLIPSVPLSPFPSSNASISVITRSDTTSSMIYLPTPSQGPFTWPNSTLTRSPSNTTYLQPSTTGLVTYASSSIVSPPANTTFSEPDFTGSVFGQSSASDGWPQNTTSHTEESWNITRTTAYTTTASPKPSETVLWSNSTRQEADATDVSGSLATSISTVLYPNSSTTVTGTGGISGVLIPPIETSSSQPSSESDNEVQITITITPVVNVTVTATPSSIPCFTLTITHGNVTELITRTVTAAHPDVTDSTGIKETTVSDVLPLSGQTTLSLSSDGETATITCNSTTKTKPTESESPCTSALSTWLNQTASATGPVPDVVTSISSSGSTSGGLRSSVSASEASAAEVLSTTSSLTSKSMSYPSSAFNVTWPSTAEPTTLVTSPISEAEWSPFRLQPEKPTTTISDKPLPSANDYPWGGTGPLHRHHNVTSLGSGANAAQAGFLRRRWAQLLGRFRDWQTGEKLDEDELELPA